MYAKKANCNLCGGNAFDLVENGEKPFKVIKCKGCSLIFVYPHPDHLELKDHYNEAYYSEWINKQSKSRIKMWQKRLSRIGKYHLKGRLLDVGCGDGKFLGLAKKQGWDIYGTDLSGYASAFASKNLNITVHCGELQTAGFEDNFFDVVTVWHVLEHVKDPKNYLTEIRRVLKPKGRLVVAVPNVQDLIMKFAYRVVKGRELKLFTTNNREIHLYHFSTKTLKNYLKETGFKLVKISPDMGFIQISYRFVNLVSVIAYHITRFPIYNSIEVTAIPE